MRKKRVQEKMSAQSAGAKTLAKVVVLTRDEYDLIEDFLIHHGALFGFENIVVVDNGSKDARVLEVYERYRAKGVTVESDVRAMTSMAQMVTDALQRHRGSCRFLIPLDTDEFMVHGTLESLSKSEGQQASSNHEDIKKRISEELEAIPDDVSVLRYGRFLGSIPDPESDDYVAFKHQRPARSVTTFYDQGWDKLIVRGDAFVAISQGNHHARTAYGRTLTLENFGLLHFHETGAARKRERCLMSMRGYRQIHFLEAQGTLEGQLRACNELIKQKLFGGHRIEQYVVFLRRAVLCHELSALASRYGTSGPMSILDIDSSRKLAPILADIAKDEDAGWRDYPDSRGCIRARLLSAVPISIRQPAGASDAADAAEPDAVVLYDPPPNLAVTAPKTVIEVQQLRAAMTSM